MTRCPLCGARLQASFFNVDGSRLDVGVYASATATPWVDRSRPDTYFAARRDLCVFDVCTNPLCETVVT